MCASSLRCEPTKQRAFSTVWVPQPAARTARRSAERTPGAALLPDTQRAVGTTRLSYKAWPSRAAISSQARREAIPWSSAPWACCSGPWELLSSARGRTAAGVRESSRPPRRREAAEVPRRSLNGSLAGRPCRTAAAIKFHQTARCVNLPSDSSPRQVFSASQESNGAAGYGP